MIGRVIEIDNVSEAEKELLSIGSDKKGIGLMLPKAVSRAIKLKRIKPVAANIIKQEMLSFGGEAATAFGSIDSAIDTMKEGAYEYLQKPCELDDLITVLTKAYGKRIKAKQAQKAARVEELLSSAVGLSPIEILERLRRLDQE